jgi:two-component system OmpR family response regulator
MRDVDQVVNTTYVEAHAINLGMEKPAHIAIVDDNPEIRELLSRYLGEHGYRISQADSAPALWKILQISAPDLIVLDIMMPGEDGLSVCRTLRATSEVPIILLTAIIEETDRIVGLEMGADDYLTKPFHPRELLARIKSVLRRVYSLPPKRGASRSNLVKFDRWTLDLGRRELIDIEGVSLPLGTAEFRLLSVLIERPFFVLTRDQLLDLTAGKVADVFDRSIDNQVSRLRRKIEADPKNPALIKTHYGGGYSFNAEVERT